MGAASRAAGAGDFPAVSRMMTGGTRTPKGGMDGIGTRLAAVGLLAFTLFTTSAFLRGWSFQGPPEAKQPMKATFYANWAASAGLLCLAVFGPGRWALAPESW